MEFRCRKCGDGFHGEGTMKEIDDTKFCFHCGKRYGVYDLIPENDDEKELIKKLKKKLKSKK